MIRTLDGANLVNGTTKERRTWEHGPTRTDTARALPATQEVRRQRSAVRNLAGSRIIEPSIRPTSATGQSEAGLPNPRYDDFRRHHGFKIRACGPRKPYQKGRVEAGVKYVKASLMNGRPIEPFELVKAAGAQWLGDIAIRGYRRYLSNPGPDHFEIDHGKARGEARYDGKWVLRTDTDLSPAEVALKYKQLWMVEDLFRELKSLVQTRPIYHHHDETIRGHVFCSFLALLLLKEMFDRLTAKGWADVEWGPLKGDLDDVERFQLECSGKTFEIRTDLAGDAGKAFRAVGVSPGPVIREVAP